MLQRIFVGLVVGLVAALNAGCDSKPRFASVSGRITLGGKPLANAYVMFQPIAPEGSAVIATGSSGKTNANGEYTLSAYTGESGACVGPHRVMIEARGDKSDHSSDAPERPSQINIIPSRYNAESTLKFDVPPEGTKDANFNLEPE